MLATTCPSSIRSRRCPPPVSRSSRRQNSRLEKRSARQKTASRDFFSSAPKLRQESRSQTLGLHQQNWLCGYDFASGCAVAPNSAGNNTSAWQLGVQWLTGNGPRVQNFGDGDPLTQTLQQHSHIQDTRNLIADNIANGGDLKGNNNYALGGLQGVPKYLKDYSTLATGGLTGNLAVTYLGSYNLSYNVTEVNFENHTATVQFHVTNDSTINSATHPPVIGYTQTWNTYIGQPLNNFFSSGPMSKTTQNFNWTETIKWPPGG